MALAIMCLTCCRFPTFLGDINGRYLSFTRCTRCQLLLYRHPQSLLEMEDNQKAERPCNVRQYRSQSATRLKSNGRTVSTALIATSLAASIAASVRPTVATRVEMALAQPLWAQTTLDPATLLYAYVLSSIS